MLNILPVAKVTKDKLGAALQEFKLADLAFQDREKTLPSDQHEHTYTISRLNGSCMLMQIGIYISLLSLRP